MAYGNDLRFQLGYNSFTVYRDTLTNQIRTIRPYFYLHRWLRNILLHSFLTDRHVNVARSSFDVVRIHCHNLRHVGHDLHYTRIRGNLLYLDGNLAYDGRHVHPLSAQDNHLRFGLDNRRNFVNLMRYLVY